MHLRPIRPMLAEAAPADLTELRYPILASPKLDGVRCIKSNGQALSRKLKRREDHRRSIMSQGEFHNSPRSEPDAE